MHREILSTLLALALMLAGAASIKASESKPDTTLEQAIAVKNQINSLDSADVPKKWISTSEEHDHGQFHEIWFYRGGHKTLVVMWSKDWTGKREKWFAATIYDGDTRVSRFVHVGESVGIMPVKDGSGYEQIVLVKDSGQITVSERNDKGYCEIIVVDGRKSHLLDDLEYTKNALVDTEVIQPFVDQLKDVRTKAHAP